MKDKRKLVSMVEFVIENYNNERASISWRAWINNYAKFLQKPLTLGMFVPTDEDGNVLEEHADYPDFKNGNHGGITDESYELCDQYEQAKERVLFEGFTYVDGQILDCNECECYMLDYPRTVEWMLPDENLTLTTTSLKLIGL